GVPGEPHSGEGGHLFAPQARRAPASSRGQAHVRRGQPAAVAKQERRQLRASAGKAPARHDITPCNRINSKIVTLSTCGKLSAPYLRKSTCHRVSCMRRRRRSHGPDGVRGLAWPSLPCPPCCWGWTSPSCTWPSRRCPWS